ncbi:MAG TPA: SDR family oxidoreductase [Anaerolineaceae bacterium]|nr:SDR family oxidoreductase [Anaerolineaceae bacterium]
MKALFIGGTGNISTSVSRLAVKLGIDLYLLNRGERKINLPGTTQIQADIHKPRQVSRLLQTHHFDCVVDWIAYEPADIERDIELFRNKTRQFIFISSASVYQRPVLNPIITEGTPLANPFWEYSRLKIACEERLMQAYRTDGFPVTIVRPSLTYDTYFPIAIGGWNTYTLVDRMKRGQPIIVHGDGNSIWVVTHADDLAVGFVGLMGHPNSLGHAFHITSDELLTWDQIYQTIAAAAGVEAKMVHIPSDFIARVNPGIGAGLLGDKVSSVIFDNTKIKTFVPEYKAVIPFHQGIRRTLAWYDEDERRKVVDTKVNEEMDAILAAYKDNLA